MPESPSTAGAQLLPEGVPAHDLDSQNDITAETSNELHVRGIPGGYRELLLIAFPLIISSGTQSLMHVIDRVFLTWYSPQAVAAALPAGILFWSLLSLPWGIVSYTNAMVAQYDGAKQLKRASQCVWQAAFVALWSGCCLVNVGFLAESIFNFIGHAGGVAPLEIEFFSWLCMGAVPALLSAALSTFFSGRGRTGLVLAVNASSMLVNAALDYALIFGNGPFPKWGIAGAAIATNTANVFAVACFIGLLTLRDSRVTYSFWKCWRFDLKLTKDLFKFGGLSGLQIFLDVAGFTVFMMIIGCIGTRELAATNIAFNLNTLAFVPVIGVGIAVSTLVGHRIGEGRPEIAEKSARKGFVLAGGIMALFGMIYVLLPQILLAPYALGVAAEDQAEFQKVSDVVIVLLRFVAIYSFFDAMAIIFGSAIRAAGDTVFSMVATFLCAWGLMVLPTWLTWHYLESSRRDELLFWSWIWCSVYITTLGFILFRRFNAGRWKTMSVIEPETA